MVFWVFMLCVGLLVPAIMMGVGLLFRKHAPRERNALFGYRTARSMASEEAWYFAQRDFAKRWLWLGAVLLPLTVAAFLLLLNKETETVAWGGLSVQAVQVAVLLLSIVPTERALKERFDGDGQPRA